MNYTSAITSSSDPGDLVIDTFCGSGTCAEAAFRTGRRFLCGDIDAKMVKMSRERVGLPVKDDAVSTKTIIPICPTLRIVPPDASLWGIHPEDITEWIKERSS